MLEDHVLRWKNVVRARKSFGSVIVRVRYSRVGTNHPRIGRLVVLLTLSGIGLSGCGGTVVQPRVGELIAIVTEARSSNQVVTLNNAEQVLTARCMTKLRYKYFPVLLTDAAVKPYLSEPESGTLASRRSEGYGFYRAIKIQVSQARKGVTANGQILDSEDAYLQSLRGQFAARYDAALFGPQNDRVVMKLVNGGAVSTGRRGCFAVARTELYGSIADYVFAFNDVPLAAELISNDVKLTKTFSTALNVYVQCMSAKGFEATTPALARDEVQQRYKDNGVNPVSHAYEIAVATSDYECGSVAHLNHAFMIGLGEIGGVVSAKLQKEAHTIATLEHASLTKAHALLGTE